MMVVTYDRWFSDPETQLDQLVDFLKESAPQLHLRSGATDLLARRIIDARKDHSSLETPALTIPITRKIYDALCNADQEQAVPDAVWQGAIEFLSAEEEIVSRLKLPR